MTTRTDRALAVLIAGLVLGLSGDVLRVWVPGRLDVTLWVGTFLLVVASLVRLRVLTVLPPAGVLAAGACLLLPCLLWRDSEVLFALNFLSLGGLLVIASAGAGITSLSRMRVDALVQGGVLLGGSAALGPLPALVSDISWADVPLVPRMRRAGGVVLGLVAAVPVLVVLGALLSSADPLFGRTLERALFFRFTGWEEHVVIVGVLAWLGVGLLRGGFWREGRSAPIVVAQPELSPAAVITFVGAVGSLLLAFVLFQVGEFFLSAESFQRVMGVTVAEYARRGFFELAWVVGLTLPMLLGADWCLARRDLRVVTWFHRVAAAVVALLLLILASAVYRMTLYESLYGLTELRFYTLVFLAWLAGVLGWFGATVLRGKRSRFLPGTLAAAFVVVMALNVANPDQMIAEVNLRRAALNTAVDAAYLVTLSADAVPTLVAAAERLPAAERCALVRGLADRWGNAGAHTGPRSDWNLARLDALRAVTQLPPPGEGCPPAPADSAQDTEARL